MWKIAHTRISTCEIFKLKKPNLILTAQILVHKLIWTVHRSANWSSDNSGKHPNVQIQPLRIRDVCVILQKFIHLGWCNVALKRWALWLVMCSSQMEQLTRIPIGILSPSFLLPFLATRCQSGLKISDRCWSKTHVNDFLISCFRWNATLQQSHAIDLHGQNVWLERFCLQITLP